ncbi:hypothetical protein K505DRAFT_123772 [Melanomma pulvis-pyrius CBS 109.77]|uniref:Uncharacterized protein n=1 Tax=Melanomma pulvis-pyrius CBS 109.77 TaxID=1314802 RepID=A0A6A6XNA4_9PLEO|nr:hypothetical protein K505DRAFT_123772 [Melanomma pulvis-pyrius CBS 109.77]
MPALRTLDPLSRTPDDSTTTKLSTLFARAGMITGSRYRKGKKLAGGRLAAVIISAIIAVIAILLLAYVCVQKKRGGRKRPRMTMLEDGNVMSDGKVKIGDEWVTPESVAAPETAHHK